MEDIIDECLIDNKYVTKNIDENKVTILDLIKKSINKTIDLYKNHSKSFFNFSFSFLLISTIFSGLISFAFCAFIIFIIGGGQFDQVSMVDSVLLHPKFSVNFETILMSILILNIGLYGVFLLREEEKGFDKKYNFSFFIKNTLNKTWSTYTWLLIIILTINAILFYDLFKVDTFNSSGIFSFLNDIPNQNSKLKFNIWANSVIDLMKIYLPFFLSMLLVLSFYYDKVNFKTIKNYKTSFFTALILSFCVNTLFIELRSYITIYIINFIKIPFANEIIPSILTLLVALIITSYFYLGFVSIIAFPFKYSTKKNSQQSREF